MLNLSNSNCEDGFSISLQLYEHKKPVQCVALKKDNDNHKQSELHIFYLEFKIIEIKKVFYQELSGMRKFLF